MATEQEIAATQKLSLELDEQVKQLVRQAQDSSKSLAPLFDGLDKEIERFVGLSQTKDQPAGMTRDCLTAAVDVIADWVDLEVEAIKAMQEADGAKTKGGEPTRSGSARPAQRRGMRI